MPQQSCLHQVIIIPFVAKVCGHRARSTKYRARYRSYFQELKYSNGIFMQMTLMMKQPACLVWETLTSYQCRDTMLWPGWPIPPSDACINWVGYMQKEEGCGSATVGEAKAPWCLKWPDLPVSSSLFIMPWDKALIKIKLYLLKFVSTVESFMWNNNINLKSKTPK